MSICPCLPKWRFFGSHSNNPGDERGGLEWDRVREEGFEGVCLSLTKETLRFKLLPEVTLWN
jgi:hypothetical protein